MCLTCGCLLPHEDHGNGDYLTIEDLERSAALDDLDLDEAVRILKERRSRLRNKRPTLTTADLFPTLPSTRWRSIREVTHG